MMPLFSLDDDKLVDSTEMNQIVDAMTQKDDLEDEDEEGMFSPRFAYYAI